MPSHKERHALGGMYVEPAKLLPLIHDAFELAEEHNRPDLADLAESVMSGVVLILRFRVGYMFKELGDRVETLEDAVNKLTRRRRKSA